MCKQRHLDIQKYTFYWAGVDGYVVAEDAIGSFFAGHLHQSLQGEYHGKRWTTYLLWKKGMFAADIHCQLTTVYMWRSCPKS
jgi:hypothetical protein